MALQQNEKNNVTEILNQAIQNGQNMIAELLGKEVSISVASIDSIVDIFSIQLIQLPFQ